MCVYFLDGVADDGGYMEGGGNVGIYFVEYKKGKNIGAQIEHDT